MFDFLLDYYFIVFFTIAVFIFGVVSSSKVNSTFRKYNKVKSRNGITASEVARQILDSNGLAHIPVIHTSGNLTDHYDPVNQVVALSDSVHNSTSVAAIGIAAHEVGHAIQHGTGYAPIKIRTAIFPVVKFSSQAWFYILLLGMLFNLPILGEIGILLFFFVFIFQLVTLPVEFNASSRAMATLDNYFILEKDELVGARKTLTAAALTYVAAALSTFATLLRLLRNNNRR